MKNGGDRFRDRGEGRLLAAALGLVLAVSLFVYTSRLPAAHTVEPVHSVDYALLRRMELVDINSASADVLAGLPGIGEELAGRILAYRLEKGPFLSEEELLGVPGIGEGKLEEIRNLIYLG